MLLQIQHQLRLIAFSLLILLSSLPAFGQKSYAPGEVLTYKAYYHLGVLWVPAATITLRVLPNEDTRFYTIRANGVSFKRYDLFFKVRENYESTIFRSTLAPITASRNAVEGSYTAKEQYRFNNANNSIDYNIAVNSEATKSGKIENSQGYFDMLSAAYYMREFDFTKLKQNQRFSVNTVINGKTYTIEIQYLGNEICKDNNKKNYICAKFGVSTIAGTVFNGDERISIWMSFDSAKIPVKVTTKLKIGEVNVELTKAEGTK
jgi:hypothetical protein